MLSASCYLEPFEPTVSSTFYVPTTEATEYHGQEYRDALSANIMIGFNIDAATGNVASFGPNDYFSVVVARDDH